MIYKLPTKPGKKLAHRRSLTLPINGYAAHDATARARGNTVYHALACDLYFFCVELLTHSYNKQRVSQEQINHSYKRKTW